MYSGDILKVKQVLPASHEPRCSRKSKSIRKRPEEKGKNQGRHRFPDIQEKVKKYIHSKNIYQYFVDSSAVNIFYRLEQIQHFLEQRSTFLKCYFFISSSSPKSVAGGPPWQAQALAARGGDR